MKNYVSYDKATGKVLGGGSTKSPESRATDTIGILVVGEYAKPSMVEVDVSGAEPVLVHLDQLTIDSRRGDLNKQRAAYEILQMSEMARLSFITKLPGQDAVYQAKYEEAVRFQADPAPDMAGYPFLSAEVGITAPTAADLATLWVQLRNGWVHAAANIEKARLVAGASLRSATTVTEVDTTITTLSAALNVVIAGA